MDPRTLATLRTMTRERLFDLGKSKPLWSDEQVDRALNEAQVRATVCARLLRDEVTDSLTKLTVTATTPVALLHRSIFDVDHAYRDIDGVPLVAMTEQALTANDANWRARTGTPCAYLLQARPDERLQLRLTPAPTEDTVVRLVVYRTPRFLMEGDDDTPEIAPIHHDGLVNWACYRLLSNRDPDQFERTAAERFKADFTAQFGELPDADTLRTRREPRERVAIARDF